ncbi:hypothetical protein [Thermoflexibacter ruber]|uniref:PIN domain-containing protein n=1 Tax=Thermoflexibacter ruber TaxID=1003 RepID=A0A1I2CSF3_9BACT|nr:hypothetical protein [Thermoflexibacter ruber]SFE71085.1 hypothetical protein SAMN04488541_1005129 [Thermoflexibacter ruber]
MQNILVDTCFWFGLFDKNDQWHKSALDILEATKKENRYLIPFPSLYEILHTQFVKNNKNNFDAFLKSHQVNFIKDDKYIKKAFERCLKPENYKYSLVDLVLRMMITGVNISIQAFITFNSNDFHDVCQERGITLLSS